MRSNHGPVNRVMRFPQLPTFTFFAEIKFSVGTIRGVTRKVRFAVEGPTPPTKDPWGNTRVAISASTKINRKDFGLTWNAALETGGILVGDEVTITLDVEFVKA